ncbi:MAG: hypothetical protein PGN19_02685 [Pseudomonas oryzihabitans]
MAYDYVTFNDFVDEAKGYLVWNGPGQVPHDVKDKVFEKQEPGFAKIDFYTPLMMGKEWLLELTLKHQPRTGSFLMRGDLAARYDTKGGVLSCPELFISIEDKIVVVGRRHAGRNPSDLNFFRFNTERHESLPSSIREAYYFRFDGLNIPLTPTIGIKSRLLPFPIGRPWKSWDGYLEEFRGYKKKYLPWLEERIPGVLPERKSSPCTNFMMFLDSRPTLSGKEGDTLFVKNHIQDGVIYHIKDADIENMRILSEPAEAIDRYCEHVLLEKPGRFDFLPYTSEM